MPQVYNWHLGRDMSYPYEGAYPERQFAFVFNINRCIACQSCTMACKSTWTFSKGQEHMWWANVETKPYGGYPMFWDMKALEMLDKANPDGQTWSGEVDREARQPYGQFDGQTIFEAAEKNLNPDSARVLGYLPTDEEWNSPNLYEDNPVGKRGVRYEFDKTGEQLPAHKTWFFYLARICNHCSYPACLAACPRKAIYKRPEDGIVLLDQKECRGYRKCVEACPYKKTMYRGNTRTSEKCIACYPRVEGTDPESGGQPMETRCMAACIGQMRMQGLVKMSKDGTWAEDRQNPIYYMVHVAKVALPLYPQFGTEPNGYYIPPRWVPRDYLRQMFGPGVDLAIERYTNPDREMLAVLQLFRRSNRIIFRYEIEEGPKVYEGTLRGRPITIYNDTVIAFGKDGKEIFRTKVEEPIHVRPAKHANSI
ncbi:MAG: nitrate oxidoreductase subunit beta [Candidatus Handelsmanbacteria bacterium RIFCSPLOWO2_12_FULL_64_10]|uniref:Nitrate oxidoreductase subunit beta n=1 Tax=Handelsmanbacteria sp. (strain RIFCSPLOWO2_12_FULL_64_10) TaxID=1817868 RepID=A0A1F6D4K5_HANXR|nr:MAG: nitrate oxidoreductase subunit beta [Candidatus Handelsmanbacteria bacterium RIFCSPLOWO2_12_FULL_64_10]